MTKDQIKHMVDRFLGWRLPQTWNPDAGISYKRPNYAHAPSEHDWPIGTNLFSADEAAAMVRHMLEGLPEKDERPLHARIERRISNLPAFTAGALATTNLARVLSDTLLERIATEAAKEAQDYYHEQKSI